MNSKGPPNGQQLCNSGQSPPITYQTTSQQVVMGTNNTTRPEYRDKSERIAVPSMPMPAAVVCCILNFLIPGFGTICAGFSAFCCSRNEDIDLSGRVVSCLIGWGIGCFQMCLVLFCLIGWFWSCAWGVFFIGMSAEYYHNNRIAADGGYINRPGQNGDGVSTVVVTQPTAPPQYSATYIPQMPVVAPPPYSTRATEQPNMTGSQPVDPAYPPPAYDY